MSGGEKAAEILARFDAARQEFLRGLFSCCEKRQSWFAIDLDVAAGKTGSPRKRIITALDYLEQSGDLKLRVSGAMLGFRRSAAEDRDLGSLREDIVHRFAVREENDLQRIRDVVALVGHQGCKTRYLLTYFGEDLDGDCGHCSCCNGEGQQTLPEPEQPWAPPDEATIAELDDLRNAHEQALGLPRQTARFLCGITSPRLTRAKLTRHKLFGALTGQSFVRVMEWAGELPPCSQPDNEESA
jgi:ATP-dependent DNA helicase RecQ